jgi:hypothetical protein
MQILSPLEDSKQSTVDILSDLSGWDGRNLSNELRSFVSEGQLQREFLLSKLSADQFFKMLLGVLDLRIIFPINKHSKMHLKKKFLSLVAWPVENSMLVSVK